MIFPYTLLLHYYVVLYNAHSIIKRPRCGSQIFFQLHVRKYTVVYTMQVVKINATRVFPGQVWHQLNFAGAVSTGHSIYDANDEYIGLLIARLIKISSVIAINIFWLKSDGKRQCMRYLFTFWIHTMLNNSQV